jgi:hypothetical protein
MAEEGVCLFLRLDLIRVATHSFHCVTKDGVRELKLAYAAVMLAAFCGFLIVAFLADFMVRSGSFADIIGPTACSELLESHLIFRKRSCLI